MNSSKISAFIIVFMMLSSVFLLEKYSQYDVIITENNVTSKSTQENARIPNNLLPAYRYPKMTNIYDLKTPKDIIIDLRFGEILFIERDGGVVEPWIPNCISTITKNGYIMPVNITKLELPYGAYNINVTVETSQYVLINIPGKIRKVEKPRTFMLGVNTFIDYEENPSALLNYEVHSGINPITLTRHKYLIIRIKPLEILNDNSARLYRYIRLRIRYTEQRNLRTLSSDQFDVLIISSKNLSQAAERLQKLKERDGLRTKIAYVEDIYRLYSGLELDKPAMIRKHINNTVRNNNIKFVIILGDDDVVPVRYAYIPDGAYDDNPDIDGKIVETDLYYADLDFSWDDNNDNKWGDLSHDKVDGYPDVLIGRLPVSNLTEALAVIDKIAKYKPSKPLYSRVLFAGTDTFMVGYPEGEYLLEYSQRFVKDMNVVKIYETYGNLTRASFVREMNNGYALVAFTGHGLPDSLALSFSQTYSIGDALNQINKILPVFVALSCDAGRFAEIDGIGEEFVLNPNGGAIAYLGSTRIAWGYIGELVTTGLMGEMFWRTIRAYFNDTLRRHLGSIWVQVIREYIDAHSIYSNLVGYYLDWKTVAEFVLLGDPTLSLIPIDKEIVQSMGVNITNDEERIVNKTIVLNGEIRIWNGTLMINNSVIILNSTSIFMYNSTLIIKDSIILWGRIIANNSEILVENSTVATDILINSTHLNIVFSAVDRIITNDTNSILNANKSSLLIVLNNVSSSIANFVASIHKSLNLSNIGLLGMAYDSYVDINVVVRNSLFVLENSSVGEIIACNATVKIVNGTVNKVVLNSSRLNASNNSLIGIELYLVFETINTILKPEMYVPKQWDLGNSTIVIEDTIIEYWSIKARSSSITLNQSRISVVECVDSRIKLNGIEAIIIRGENSSIEINASRILSIFVSGDVSIMYSNITEIWVHGNANISQYSKVNVLHISSSTVNINRTRIYNAYLEGGSNMLAYNSIIVTIVVSDVSSFNASGTRIAVLDCEGNSSIYLMRTDVLYWLRIYDRASVYVEGGKVWMGLVYENKEEEIHYLYPGKITEKTLGEGWNITLRDAEVIGWDIIAYSSNITVSNSSLGWIILYYDSNIKIDYADVSLLRATHNSSAIVGNSIVSSAFISGNAKASFSSTYLGSLYVLGRGDVSIHSSTFEIIAGMGIDAKIEIDKSYGGYVAAIKNVSIDISNSKFTMYLAFSSIVDVFSGYYPDYYVWWDSYEFDFPTEWEVRVKYSWISWAFDFESSNITILNSFLNDLYAMNSNITLINVKVTDFFAAFGSSIRVKSSWIYGIDFVWLSEIEIINTVAPSLYIVDSKLTSRNSLVGIILFLMEGTHSGTLNPGFYHNVTLDDFFNTTSKTDIKLINSSVYGWAVFGVGTSGTVNITISNSKLLGVGVAYNASLDVENTFIYGYTEIIYGVFGKPKVTLRNTITRLYLFLQKIEDEIVLQDFDEIVWGYTGSLLDDVVFNNVTITEINIEAYYSNIIVSKSVVEEMNIQASNLTVIDSKISTMTTYVSNYTILRTNISSLHDLASNITIKDSKVNRLRLIGSYVFIEDSSIGIDIALMFSSLYASSLSPIYIPSAELYSDIPVPAFGSLRNVEITRWFITLNEFSSAIIEDSNITSISLGGHHSYLKIISSNVNSVVLSAGNLYVDSSTIGIEIQTKSIAMSIRNLRKTMYNYTDSSTLFGGYSLFEVTIIDTKIVGVNITSESSKITISDSEIDYGIFDTSIVEIDNVKALVLISRIITNTTIRKSWVRLVNSGIGGTTQIVDSKAGLIDMYIYGNIEASHTTSGNQKIYNEQIGSYLSIVNSEIFDWSILSSYTANVTVKEDKIFMASADGIAKLWLIDTYIEYPVDVYDLGEVHLIFTVEIEVIYDLMKPNKADIEIEGKNTSIKATVENGYYKTLLYQGIIRSYERIDLGEYTITAKVSMFSGTKKIYIWKPLKIKIYIYGPTTMGLIAAIIAAITYFFLFKQEWIKEKLRKAKEKQNIEEEHYTSNIST